MTTFEKTKEELTRQGLVYETEEYGLTFKYQMVTYLYLYDKSDDEFFSLYVPYIFDVDEQNELAVLKAMNAINNSIKVIKLVINDGSVWVCFEDELPRDAVIEDILPYAVAGLFKARTQFYEMLKEA